MASSPLRLKSKYHTRSVSFPSSSHPLIHQFNENLCKLRSSSESTSSSSSSFPSITTRLSGLEDLYNCVDDLLLAPKLTNQTSIDEALDGFLTLLDVCTTTKDIFSQAREEIKQLLSSIRRNKNCTFQEYVAARKKAIMVIRKLLKDLKSISKKDSEDVSADILKEAQAATVSVLESLLSYVAGTKAHSKSLMSKLLQKKSETKEVVSEFEQIDFSLHSVKNTETEQNQLEKLQLSIENLEDVMERLIRRLIKTRVSLFNILNH